MYMYLIYI